MKDLSYYKKLGFEKIFSWKQEDFSNFLVWDLVEAFKYGDLKICLLGSIKNLIQRYNKYKFALDIYDKFFQKLWLKNNRKDKKILFHTIQYPKLILEAKKHYSVGLIVEGKKDRLFSFKNFIGYVNVNDLSQYIYYYVKEGNINYLYQLVKSLEERLSALRPDYLVLWNDNLPLERAIVLVCKRLGIPTLEIQQGPDQSGILLTSGRMVDYFLVWGQYFKDLYVRREIKKPEEIYVLGYPHKIYKTNKPKSKDKNKYTVYYLGQNYERCNIYERCSNKEILEVTIKTVIELNRICKKLNLEFFYRPHPRNDRELIKSKLPGINFTPEDEKISDTINKGDILVSFNSTSLIEASMISKITLQLMNYPRPTDNFEKLGVCTKSFQSIEELSRYLQLIRGSDLSKVKFKFNNYYTETRYNLGQRFIEILNQIDDKQTKELGF